VFNTSAFDALLTSELAAIPDSPAKANGIAVGARAAADMLAARANDGAASRANVLLVLMTRQVPPSADSTPREPEFQENL
jgi:hypothetical protein